VQTGPAGSAQTVSHAGCAAPTPPVPSPPRPFLYEGDSLADVTSEPAGTRDAGSSKTTLGLAPLTALLGQEPTGGEIRHVGGAACAVIGGQEVVADHE
jgi:hypothetical protein